MPYVPPEMNRGCSSSNKGINGYLDLIALLVSNLSYFESASHSMGAGAHCVGSDVGDVAELYASLSERLERIVGMDVHAPRPLIEDACQSAWNRLWVHRLQVRRE